jgi:hypothetical protein
MSTLKPFASGDRVHVTETVLKPLIAGALGDIWPRPKSKVCALIWQSTGCAGHCAGGLALGAPTSWAHAGSESNAKHATITKRVIGT